MFKKLISIAVTLLIMAQALTVFAMDFKAEKGTPTIDGVISEGEYSEESKFVMDKAFVDSVNGCYAGQMTDDMSVTYYFAWDDNNLYIAAVTKDSTPMPAVEYDPHGAYEGDWVASDALQFAFHPSTLGLWYTVGGYEDGTLAAIANFINTHDMSPYITGKCTHGDNSVVYEIAFPWKTLHDNMDIMISIDEGAVDAEGNPIVPTYANLPEAGASFTIMFAYLDRYDRTVSDTNVRYKNVRGDLWPSSDEFTDRIVLVDSTPAVTEAPVTEAPATEAPETSAPDTDIPAVPTSDIALVAGAVALVAAAAIVIAKKRK